MRVPQSVLDKYGVLGLDADAQMLLRQWDEPCPGRVLVVGAHDEPTANMLADSGWDVTGVDLREYDKALPPCNYRFVRGDFCLMDRLHLADMRADGGIGSTPFDAVVALSCIEHFGLGTYSEGDYHPYYDVLAMRRAWELLREGGRCYVTVPMGNPFAEVRPHWRVYDLRAIQERLQQDFVLDHATYAVAAPLMFGTSVVPKNATLPAQAAVTYNGHPPHLNILLVFRKVPVRRLAPDGR